MLRQNKLVLGAGVNGNTKYIWWKYNINSFIESLTATVLYLGIFVCYIFFFHSLTQSLSSPSLRVLVQGWCRYEFESVLLRHKSQCSLTSL